MEIDAARSRLVAHAGGTSSADSALRALEASLERLLGAAPRGATELARGRADALAAMTPGSSGTAAAAITYTAEVLAAHLLEREIAGSRIAPLTAEVALITGLDAGLVDAGVFSAALRSRTILELPPRVAAEACVRLLHTFAGVSEASLWVRADAGRPACAVIVGADAPSRRVRRVAAAAFVETLPPSPGAVLQAVPVVQWDRPLGVLVLRAPAEGRNRAAGYASELALALVPILEKETLLESNQARAGALTGASERLLVRLGLDLHDGPLQEIAALAIELRLFKGQLGSAELDGSAAALLGRVDDLLARVAATEQGLRSLANSLEAPTVVRAPLHELMEQQVERLRSNGFDVAFGFRGGSEELTASQRIALVRFVEEAFTNVHEHSGATRVTLNVTIGRANLRAVVEDDGRGFDVERALVESARKGQLGLVGMGERMRLLGGRLDIDSSQGGPTTVTATIPRWNPASAS